MIVYWDKKDHSFIIENDNGKRMRVTSKMVQNNPTSNYMIMRDAVLIHKIDPLDSFSIGDHVNPDEVASEGVVLRLIGTDGLIIYCLGQWRLTNGNGLGFPVDQAVLHSKENKSLLQLVRHRLDF